MKRSTLYIMAVMVLLVVQAWPMSHCPRKPKTARPAPA